MQPSFHAAPFGSLKLKTAKSRCNIQRGFGFARKFYNTLHCCTLKRYPSPSLYVQPCYIFCEQPLAHFFLSRHTPATNQRKVVH